MAGKSLVPEPFGPLQGVRVVSTGRLIAQPFAAAMCAEMGAEVIQVERPGAGDVGWRLLGVQLPARDGENVHTNSIESFRALLRRGIVGAFHNVSKDYLPLYLNEFSFRHNHRKDPNMFEALLQNV